MCDPTTIALASLAAGVGQSVVGYVGAQANYDNQIDAYNQNAQNAATTAAQNYRNINIRVQQEDQAANQQKQESAIEAAQAVATAQAAAEAGGVGGLSVDAVLRDIYAQAGRNEAVTDANLRMSRGYLEGEAKAAQLSGQNQINSMAIPEKPSPFPYLLGAFSSGISAYTTKMQMENT